MLSRDLTAQLNTAIQFLVECRPLSVSMGNAIKFVKMQASPTGLFLAQPRLCEGLSELRPHCMRFRKGRVEDSLVSLTVAS